MSPRSRTFVGRLLFDGALLLLAVVGLQLMAHAAPLAGWMGWDRDPWVARLFDGGMTVAFLGFGALLARWVLAAVRLGRRARGTDGGLLGSARGTIVVEFALLFPMIGLVLVIIVQLALLANAALVVRHAAFTGARTAIVGLERSWQLSGVPKTRPSPDGRGLELYYPSLYGLRAPFLREHFKAGAEAESRRAARLILAAISPANPGATPDPDAALLTAIHANAARRNPGDSWGARDLGRRMHYSTLASTIGFRELVDRDQVGKAPYYSTANMALDYLKKKVVDLLMGIANKIMAKLPLEARLVLAITPIGALLQKIIRDVLEAVLDPVLEQALGPILDGRVPDIYGPPGIEVSVTYQYRVPLPGIQLIPGVTKAAPAPYGGRVFEIQAWAWLQSTGAREAHPIALLDGKPLP